MRCGSYCRNGVTNEEDTSVIVCSFDQLSLLLPVIIEQNISAEEIIKQSRGAINGVHVVKYSGRRAYVPVLWQQKRLNAIGSL
jgi:hypothetical protein